MTLPRTPGSRPVAPLTQAGQPHATPLPTGLSPSPGTPGFIGATSRERTQPGHHRRRAAAPLAWLPWAALAALVALLVLVAVTAAFVGGTAGTSRSALTVGSSDLLARRTPLAQLAGRPVTGHRVLVQSVVADEGFWVGPSAADRVFVHLTPKARTTNGESPFQVRAGQHVDLTGTVARLASGGAARLGVTGAEGARQLAAQGGYVAASTVRLSR